MPPFAIAVAYVENNILKSTVTNCRVRATKIGRKPSLHSENMKKNAVHSASMVSWQGFKSTKEHGDTVYACNCTEPV